MSTNKRLFESAVSAIDDLYSDMGVSREKCLENMRELRALVDIKIEAVTVDMKRAKR